MNSRPSGSVTCPAQKRLRPFGTGSNVLVAGSQTRSEFTAASKPSQTATLPFDSIAMCTGTSGHVVGGANWPVRSGPDGGAPAVTGVSMSVRTSAALSARR